MTKKKEIKKTQDPANDEKPAGKPAARPARKKSKVAKGVSDVITGDILSNRGIRRWYPLALWIVVLVFIYIGHNFNFQRLQRLEIKSQLSLNEERSRAMVFLSLRMNASRPSVIMEEINRRGIPLEESTVPPKKIETTPAR